MPPPRSQSVTQESNLAIPVYQTGPYDRMGRDGCTNSVIKLQPYKHRTGDSNPDEAVLETTRHSLRYPIQHRVRGGRYNASLWGTMPLCGGPPGTRTLTERVLKPLPLPLG